MLLLLLLLLLCFSFNPSLLCHLPQGRALYTIRHRIGQQGTKDKGTTGDKRQRDKAQQAHRHRKDNRGPKTEGQQGTKDRTKTTGDKKTEGHGTDSRLHFYVHFYCISFSFSPILLCHLPQSRALAAGEQPGRIKVHWSSAEISAWFPLLLQPYLLLLLSI